MKASFLLYKPSIICIVETWLDSDILDSEICFPNYELIRLDKERHGGGVAIYISAHLPFRVIFFGPLSLGFLAISVLSPFGQFPVSVFCRPPSSNVFVFDNLSVALEDLCAPLFPHLFPFGDFNVEVSIPG